MIGRFAPVLLSLLLAAGGVLFALPAAADESVEAMMQEIQQLSAEKSKNENILMQPNLGRQESLRKLDADKRSIEAEIDRNEARIDSLCSQYSCTGQGSGTITVHCPADGASCDSAVKSTDAQVKQTKARREAYNAARAAAEKQGPSNEELVKRNKEIDARIKMLQAKINARRAVDYTRAYTLCQERAAGVASLDSAVQDFNACVDQARQAKELPTVEKQTGRVFPDDMARQMEAIEKYKKSGAVRPGPPSFRDVYVPRPELPEPPQTPSNK